MKPVRIAHHTIFKTTALLAACMGSSACSIISPMPAFELAKAMGTAASTAISLAPTEATDTVYHLHRKASFWCIEINRESQVLDIVPAIQNELQGQGVESRLYEVGNTPPDCPAVLHYNGYLRWDLPLWGKDYQAYLHAATLTLRSNSGEVLASTRYELDTLGTGKWASTRKKMAPLVKALITGFNS